MTKKPFATVLILALIVSALAGTLLVNMGIANPTAWPTTVTLLSPANKTYGQNTVYVAFKYSDQGKYNPYYKYTLDGNESELLLADFDGSVNHAEITGLSEGAHTLVIHVMANSGGPPPASWNLDWYSGYSNAAIFTIDTTPPNIKLLSPENKTYYTSNIAFNFTVNESVSKTSYVLDGQRNVTLSGDTMLAELPVGEHTITVYATDKVGNTGASKTMYFSISTPEPFSTALVVASVSGMSLAVIGLGLLIYFRKRNHLKIKS